MNYLKSTFFVFTISIFWLTCKSDSKNKTPAVNTVSENTKEPAAPRVIFQPDQLIGEWILTKAAMNRKKTSRLDSAYFVFTTDLILKTNLTGEAVEGSYLLEGKKLSQQTEEPIEYNIEKLINDSMIMNFRYKRKKFRILLEK